MLNYLVISFLSFLDFVFQYYSLSHFFFTLNTQLYFCSFAFQFLNLGYHPLEFVFQNYFYVLYYLSSFLKFFIRILTSFIFIHLLIIFLIELYNHSQDMKADLPKKMKQITSRFSLNENKHLGKGVFGNVYEGYDNETKKIIAVKHLIRPQNFKDQVETLQKLSTLTHPNIMGFYGYTADSEDVYLFVQYCPGGVLTNLIKKGLDQERILDILRQLVEGMCYMNAKGIMHRDLKPDNILIGINDDIKISDFGLAKIQDGLDKTGHMGTPLYAGPQIFSLNCTESYNYNCDVWSAGIILHEMLTGKHPFNYIKPMESIYDLKDEWKLFEKSERRISYNKNIHPQWQYITNIMLTFNYKKRPMFHDILQILKKLDDNGAMRKQIKNAKKGIKTEQNFKQTVLQYYLSFIEQKSDVLVEFAQILTPEKYPHIRSSLQQILIFLAMTWYIIKIKNVIRSLKFKNLKYPNNQEVIDNKNQDDKANLIMDKYRNIFEGKLAKNQNYLKQKIIPKLAEEQCNPEEKKQFKSIQSAYRLFLEAKQNTYDVESTYEQQFIRLLNFHKIKPTEQKLSTMTIKQQQIYAKILFVGFLNSQLPDNMYATKGFVRSKIHDITNMNPIELEAYISKLRNQLK